LGTQIEPKIAGGKWNRWKDVVAELVRLGVNRLKSPSQCPPTAVGAQLERGRQIPGIAALSTNAGVAAGTECAGGCRQIRRVVLIETVGPDQAAM